MTSDAGDGHHYYRPHVQLGRPFGDDWFGRKAEAFARNFGTPVFLIGQTKQIRMLFESNTVLTAEVARLARELHRHALGAGTGGRPINTQP
jgi:hypothetical protein